MNAIKSYSRPELLELQQKLLKEYSDYKSSKLSLDMSRGKPGSEQLDLLEEMLSAIKTNEDCFTQNNTDVRNYGLIDGIPEAKALFADLMGVTPDCVIVGGNSSLNMMYDSISRAMTHGVLGSPSPWGKPDKVKFLCPAPGYDRHFSICEFFGIEMINIGMTPGGPDMDAIEKLVSNDKNIKGLWCVPLYSNPQGVTYSDETVRRLAALKPAAPDFRIFWDNAYIVHHLSDKKDTLQNLLALTKGTANENMVYQFVSTSKISYPGAGVAAMSASSANVEFIKKQMFVQTIGPDKLNQLRHIKYLKSVDGINNLMKKHAGILKPKFDMVITKLNENLKNIAEFCAPNGGYFVSVDLVPGCAKRTLELLKDAGVVMTGAGATFPYGKDPKDSNIRIAPTFPPVSELKTAMELFCVCVKLATIENALR